VDPLEGFPKPWIFDARLSRLLNYQNMHDQLDPFFSTRQTLLSRLKDWEDHESWRDFFDTYWRLIYGLAVKSGLTPTEAEDVVQETLLAVAKEMPDFKYDPALGTFKGWLFEITRRRIANQVRRRLKHRPATAGSLANEPIRQPSGRRGEPDQKRTATIERVPDPNSGELEGLWDQEWQRNLLETSIVRVKKRVNPKQYQMFNLYVMLQWPMNQVKKTLGVSAAQVYMAKMRISRLLKSEVKTLEREMS
jgi:RNA polymerase sigma factor (sigma-70 family)